ncbi:MAG: orotidine-5'-phosphate decarboxylase [Terriglobia bacterium]|jgi:orotidine-5'-phosphate decarboxylase
MTTRDKLIVALDLPSGDAATRMAERLQGHVGMFKVGSELFTAEGPVPVRYLVTTGHRVFLDLKFHDILNTVRAAAREAAELGVSMVNVHASGGRKMMEAALEGVRSTLHHPAQGSAGIVVGDEARPRVLAVTILTSLASQDLEELGISGAPVEAVLRLARLAQSAGLDGVVASPREISAIRQACGPGFLIVTPGIRPASALHHPVRGSAATDDQARIATPASAIAAGADYLVVGRPITGAPDPVAAADAIVAEMDGALSTARASAAARQAL